VKEAIEDGGVDRPGYMSLGEALRQGNSPGAIATAIETEGIFCWDRFGRWKQVIAGSKEANDALDLCARVYEYECTSHDSEDVHPTDACAGDPDDPFGLLGWPLKPAPGFAEQKISPVKPTAARASAETNRRQTYLTFIEGLLRHNNLPSDDRYTTGKLKVLFEPMGLGITDDTIRSVLKELCDGGARTS
jgi:hypothetical protein